MVVEAAVRREGVVDAVADGVAQLVLGHAAVQGERGDEVDVVDAGRGGQVEHGLDDALAHVGPAHRRQRQGDVVERDGELHARRGAARAGVASRRAGCRGRGGSRRRGPRGRRAARRGRARGCARPAASRAGSPRRGGRGSAGSSGRPRGRTRDGASDAVSLSFRRRSKAILTAPRAPAAAAWAMASS